MSGCVPAALVGVPPATLAVWLGQAQQALQNLMTGQLAATVSYAEGQGQRSVTYTKANLPDLREWIGELNAALGRGRQRRAIGVMFR